MVTQIKNYTHKNSQVSKFDVNFCKINSINNHDEYDSYIAKYAEEFGVDPWLVKCVIQKESSYNPNAGSAAGARGLMQITEITAKDLGIPYDESLFDPETNIAAGTEYLAKMLKRFDNNIELALAAYNAEPTRISNLGAIPQNGETPDYVNKITTWYGSVQGNNPLFPSIHHWSLEEREGIEANLKERYGNYKYDISYNLDGTYTFKIYDSNGNAVVL